jgi:hypothetical protein
MINFNTYESIKLSMVAYKEMPASEDPGIKTVISVVRMSTNGLTEKDKKKLIDIARARREVVGQLQHDSSRKLCEMTEYHNGKMEESVALPKLVKKPLVEKAAHLMAESASANVRIKNILGASNEDRQTIVLLLKELGIKDNCITQDNLGLITVLENGEHKNPETVVYSKLYERYLQQLRNILKE